MGDVERAKHILAQSSEAAHADSGHIKPLAAGTSLERCPLMICDRRPCTILACVARVNVNAAAQLAKQHDRLQTP